MKIIHNWDLDGMYYLNFLLKPNNNRMGSNIGTFDGVFPSPNGTVSLNKIKQQEWLTSSLSKLLSNFNVILFFLSFIFQVPWKCTDIVVPRIKINVRHVCRQSRLVSPFPRFSPILRRMRVILVRFQYGSNDWFACQCSDGQINADSQNVTWKWIGTRSGGTLVHYVNLLSLSWGWMILLAVLL